jgi:diguanylate cyclase (GGDEF)-like protein/putative nucleotidyltransferase with HDIG domain
MSQRSSIDARLVATLARLRPARVTDGGAPTDELGQVSRRSSSRFAVACAVLGVLLAVFGAALVASRRSSEQARLDRTLSTTAGEKSALVDTELERVRALALITARIPPFEELYADAGSQAAAIAAVAGPGREINNALTYLWRLYSDRFVEAGYVDRDGLENARVVRGTATPPKGLLKDVRSWPSFAQGHETPAGSASITAPFLSPTAGVQVVAATAPVTVDGRIRAWVELELATTALRRALATDVPRDVGVQIVNRSGTTMAAIGPHFSVPRADLRPGLDSAGRVRYGIRALPEKSLASGPWFVVAGAPAPSTLSFAVAPGQAAILLLALLLLVAAFVGFRRARSFAATELATEQAARAEAERMSRIDAMTGLFNRRHAMETIEHELARTGREDRAVGVLMFDVDYFKRINDTNGHAGGDTVLIEVARRLRAGVREWDVVARVGGEEFCVIAPGLENEKAVEELGDRLREAVAERGMRVGNGVALPVTISVGAVLVREGDGSAEHAMDCADRALYAAKRRGRNRICRFSQLDQGDLRAEQPECLHLAEALAVAGDLREGGTATHSRQVAELSAAVAERLGLGEDDVLRVRVGGWLHDVGKIAVPDGILTKPGKLTDEEWELIRTHPAVGDELLRKFPELSFSCAAVRHHHERYDGAGYPDQLAGEDIPLDARIVGAVDAYCAMTSERPYELSRSPTEAIAELRRCAGEHFDPTVVGTLIIVLNRLSAGLAAA